MPNLSRSFSARLHSLPSVWGWSFVCGVGAIIAAGSAPVRGIEPPAPAPPVTPEQAVFFETKVRPLLVEACIGCHGKNAQMGGLRMDGREALLKGGDTGPSLVPGDVEKSLLISAVRHTGKLKMPQGGKLSSEQIEVLAAWVKMGAPWPEAKGQVGMTQGQAGKEAWRGFWSLQPVKMPVVPKVKPVKAGESKPANAVDAFVLSRLQSKGLGFAPPADKRTLLRRVTFDLTGLPPTPNETSAFLADKSPNAYEKVVERLLASPAYGERWARLWLDLARYADTKGYVFTEDRAYPWAWTYRDYVIRAFNNDLPYDRFLIEQLAADKLPDVANGEDKRPLAALGFLTIGRRFLNNTPDIIDDRIDTTMRGFQGLTVACARCHDHKFDPIPTKDYYSLYGVFDSSEETMPPISPANVSKPWTEHDAKVKATDNQLRELVQSEVKRLRQADKDAKESKAAPLPEEASKTLAGFREGEYPDDGKLAKLIPVFTDDNKAKLQTLKSELEGLRKSYPPQPDLAMAVKDRDNGHNVKVFKRGNPGNQGDEAPRRFLLALSKPNEERALWKEGSGRLELARAIASKNNPLTARVFVNRVWQGHFGFGLVRTPSDFGKQGEKPTHPELLDYLASRFMQNGWSVKKLHRLVVTSATYQQSADGSPKAQLLDPENRLLAHQNRRRLDLEQMRDALLWAANKLDTKQVGGKSVELWGSGAVPRRSVYGYIERQNLPGIFKTFDFATPDSTTGQRFRTTVPQQGLFLMNSPFVAELARELSELPDVKTAQNEEARVRRLYLRLFGRLPDADEMTVARAYLGLGPAAPKPERMATVWQYGYGQWNEKSGKVENFTPFKHFDPKQGWRVGSIFPDKDLGYLFLSGEDGHPGRDAAHAVVRRWTAPRTMTVSITGSLRHGQKEGDGVRGVVVSSRQGIVAQWVAANRQVTTYVASVTVQAGDTVDFVVEPQASDNSDSFAWSPVIREAMVAQGMVWQAKRDFAGPASASLGPWARYAQALLLTNEFMFVD